MSNGRKCGRCDTFKTYDNFYKNKSNKDGHDTICKECQKKKSKKYYKENKEKVCENSKNWYERNRETRLKEMRRWYQENKDDLYARRRSNPQRVIYNALGARIRKVITNNSKSKSTQELLGLPISEFLEYLESQFRDGMSWDNYGEVWHIDHIVPCAHFDLSKQHHQQECFFYTNLQPLLVEENLKKSNTLMYDTGEG